MRCIESSESFFGHHQHSPWLVSWRPQVMLARTRSSDPSHLSASVRAAGSRGEDYRSEPGAAVPCGRGPLYRKRPEPSDFDGWGWVGLDEIDVIFLCAWLAAPVELRGSRPELGAIDDDVRQTQMTPGVRGD